MMKKVDQFKARLTFLEGTIARADYGSVASDH